MSRRSISVSPVTPSCRYLPLSSNERKRVCVLSFPLSLCIFHLCCLRVSFLQIVFLAEAQRMRHGRPLCEARRIPPPTWTVIDSILDVSLNFARQEAIPCQNLLIKGFQSRQHGIMHCLSQCVPIPAWNLA